MAKKSKLTTPAWMLEGYDSKEEYEKSTGKKREKKSEKTFKIRECPKCQSNDVRLVLSNSDAGLELEIPSDSSKSQVKEGGEIEWECLKCKWQGADVVRKELTEDDFMKYLDDRGEDVA